MSTPTTAIETADTFGVGSTQRNTTVEAPGRRRGMGRLLAVLLALFGLLLTPVSATAAPAHAATNTAGYGFTFYAGYLKAHQKQRYCWDYAGYAYHGAVVATATALEYNATLRVSDTEVDLLSGRYYYCAYVENLSAIPTGVNIVQRTAIAFAYSMLLNEGFLHGLSQQEYCFVTPSHADLGPVVVSAHGSPDGFGLVVLNTSLTNRYGYGWTYCATVSNTDGVGTNVTLDIGIGPSTSNHYEDYVGYLPANTTKTYCWYMPTSSVPGVATAKATNYDAELQTLSLSRSAINATNSVYCAAIDNVSSVGTDVTIHTQSGL